MCVHFQSRINFLTSHSSNRRSVAFTKNKKVCAQH